MSTRYEGHPQILEMSRAPSPSLAGVGDLLEGLYQGGVGYAGGSG